MPRKKATSSANQPEAESRTRPATKTARTRRTTTRAAAENPAPARPARKRAASTSRAKQATTRSARPAPQAARTSNANPASGRTRPTAAGQHTNGNGGIPAGKTARDYGEVKRALGILWDDITKQTYSTFDSITRRVEKSYEDARKNVTQGDVRYALDKTQSKLKSLGNSGSQNAVRLGRQARLLYEMLRDAMAGKFKMPWVTVSAITAALLYFISPLDIIPDFIPGIGWMDDALVIALAVSVARVDLRRYIKENQLDPAEYGL